MGPDPIYTEADYQYLRYLLARAEGINRWRERALRSLLNAGPRLAKLGDSFYMGCGFHYDKVHRYAMCVDGVKLGFQPCMNHFKKSKEEYFNQLTLQVCVSAFFKELAEAELSVQQMKKKELEAMDGKLEDELKEEAHE